MVQQAGDRLIERGSVQQPIGKEPNCSALARAVATDSYSTMMRTPLNNVLEVQASNASIRFQGHNLKPIWSRRSRHMTIVQSNIAITG